jgi:hypothetical protein
MRARAAERTLVVLAEAAMGFNWLMVFVMKEQR